MILKRLALASALLIASGIANALPPPPDWQPTIYAGPGRFCGDSFELVLRPGERMVAGWAAEGSSDYEFQSSAGFLELTEWWLPKWEYQRTRLYRPLEGSKLYKFQQKILRPEFGSKTIENISGYVFLPDKNGITLEVPYPPFTPRGARRLIGAEYKSVVERLEFPRKTPRSACLRAVTKLK